MGTGLGERMANTLMHTKSPFMGQRLMLERGHLEEWSPTIFLHTRWVGKMVATPEEACLRKSEATAKHPI